MTDQADRIPTRERLGRAVNAYLRDEFAGLGEMLCWFNPLNEGNWRWKSVLPLTAAFLAVGVGLDASDADGVPGIVGSVLLIVALPVVFGLPSGTLVACLLLNTFAPQNKGSLLRRVRERLAEFIEQREQWLPSGHYARAPWRAWRIELLSSSPPSRFMPGGWVTLVSTLAALGVANWIAAAHASVPSPLVTALLIGVLLVVAASVMARANRELNERHFPCTLKGLARDRRDQEHLAAYPSSRGVDAIGVTGVVLAAPAPFVAVTFLVEVLLNSSLS